MTGSVAESPPDGPRVDGGVVPGIQIGNRAGANTIVRNLTEVWAEAERLIGAPIDPLDPRYLDDY